MISFLKKDKDFNRVIKCGKKISGRIAFARYIENNASSSRFGVVVPKNVIAHAVDRNRLKRIYKEAIRNTEYISKKPIDLVIFPRKKAAKDTFWEAGNFINSIING